jgi:hypothetical protein
MIRFLLGYVLGPPAERPVYTGPLPTNTIEKVAETFSMIMRKTSTGQKR